MTTEAGSETEVKKEPEKAEEEAQPAATQQDENQNQDQASADPKDTEPAASNPEPASSDTAAQENQTSDSKPEEPAEPASPPPGSGQKKEKGISRFLPPWLKRQKSQSQVEPKEVAPKEGSAEPVKEEVKEEQKAEKEEETSAPSQPPAPEPEAKEVKPEVKETPAEETQPPKEVQAEEEKEKEEEKKSVGSADTQPAKEEKVEEVEEKAKEETKAEEEKKEEEPNAKPETNILSPLKLTKKMKMVICHVTLLDGSQFECEVEKRAKGQYLFFKVCEHLNLLEKDYFGLSFKDNADQRCWLDPLKEIKRQIRNSQWQFAFNVKFYPPDPSQLTEDITRYLLCLQLRQDIASGRLPCSFVTHALLGSYSLQAELGDYDPEEHRLDYISDFQFAPNQTKELEAKVVELHKSHRGMTPAQADAQFLENAKKLSMYGVDLHHAKDSDGVDIMLGVCANGLLIYKDRLRINRFAWPKILKISYKRSNFYIKIRPGETEQFESTVGFKLPNHRAAKRVWKVCVEHHTFFRLMTPDQPTKAKFLTLGSKFRYSGRTQAQTRQASALIDRPAPYFERTSSKRISRSLDGAPVVSVSDHSAPPLSAGEKENGHDPALELSSDSKSKLRVQGENIYVRHSNLMLEDLDKTQEEVLRHQASISELKRSFMEATPEPRPSVWDKRLTSSPATSLRLQAQGSADDKQKSEASGVQAVVEVEETVVIEEIRKAPKAASSAPEESVTVTAETEKPQEPKEEKRLSRQTSVSSDSESEEEAEYHPHTPCVSVSVEQIKEEPEDEEKESEQHQKAPPTAPSEPIAEAKPAEPAHVEAEQPPVPVAEQPEEEGSTDEALATPDEAPNGHTEASSDQGTANVEEEEPRVNGDASHVEAERLPQVICCSEPPVVKTEMVTISDTFAAQKTEIATKEVPIVHTETKTITYEAAQLDGSGDGEPGVLMTAQTITSESLCTTTTTHITKTLKGGLSETRIEKRIVITGDSDIDHDQALAQAIKEAKEQHPDMSVTRVVVHKETELAEEGDD
ncbi:band 4.1-like protein 2 [Chanos chanos]|uniref:Band 4.1-like protein 2 n=1 Tax=Chanos chanos TaxID=29144 RepID=A0A6J2VXH9_CHACN|nr:band 4.1-like protein 2 [Chanos chanos]